MKPVSERRWQLRRTALATEAVAELSRQLVIPPLLARLFVARGLSSEEAGEFLGGRLADLPEPLLLPDMDRAVERVLRAVRGGEPIAVHGDYDVDGISGTTLLVQGLRACGAVVDYHIPLRLRDGYGLSAVALEMAAASGVRLVISVDCGVSAQEEARLAAGLGLDLIITDHHQPPVELPPALAVVNPQRPDSRFPQRDLAGVGVAFFLLAAVRRALREAGWFGQRPEPDLREVLDLVALGTIADLVPLQGVNRTLTRIGLSLMDNGARPGIRALKEVAGVRGVNCGVVGFQLAPRLNAAGRLEDAARAVELLLEPDQAKALATARLLDRFNRERQQIEQATFDEAAAMAMALPDEHTHALVLASDGWHAGVIGIVASRLVERFYRPTLLIALDGEGGKGSGRSIRGLHLYQTLQQCASHLLAFGGHEMAAGLSIARDQVPVFAQAFESEVRAALSDEQLVPVLLYDGVGLLEEFTREQIEALERLAPFGMGNPEPALLVEQVRVRQLQRAGEGHLRFLACQGGDSLPAIAFGMSGRMAEFQGTVDLLVSPQINRYNGRETVQLRVRDVRGCVERIF